MGAARRQLIMISFWSSFGLAFIATTLLASGATHAIGFSSFRNLIRDHAIIPSRGAPIVALLTVLAELTAGAAALVFLLSQSTAGPTVVLFAVTGALGVAFVLYLRRLLRQPHRASGCGCTPLSSPLTPASQLPGAALAAVSATALVAAFLQIRYGGAADPDSVGPLAVMAPLWGLTLAVLVMLVPASVPSLTVDRRP